MSLVATAAEGQNLPYLCGSVTKPTGCQLMEWDAIDFTTPTAPAPCNYAGGYFVAGFVAGGAFDCQLAGGGGGVTDHGALTGLADDDHSQYVLLAGRTGATNDPTISTDGIGTIRGSATLGFSLDLGPDAGTADVHVQRNGVGENRLLIGPGLDWTNIFVADGILNFLSTNEGGPVGAPFGAAYAGNSPGGKPIFLGFRSRGTFLVPVHTEQHDELFQLSVDGFDDTDTFIGSPAFSISVTQPGVPGTGYVSADMTISTVDENGVSAPRLAILGNGALAFPVPVEFGGNPPTCVTNCASVDGNDRIFDVTVDAGVITSVTVDFSTTLASIPKCVVSTNTVTAPAAVTAVSATSVAFGTAATIGGGIITAHCFEKL